MTRSSIPGESELTAAVSKSLPRREPDRAVDADHAAQIVAGGPQGGSVAAETVAEYLVQSIDCDDDSIGANGRRQGCCGGWCAAGDERLSTATGRHHGHRIGGK